MEKKKKEKRMEVDLINIMRSFSFLSLPIQAPFDVSIITNPYQSHNQ